MTDPTVSPPAAEREPDHVTPAVRNCGQIQAHEPHGWPDAAGDAWRCEGGWTLDQFAEVFPEAIHFDAGRADQRAACGFDLDRQGPDGWTTDPAKVKCAECSAQLTSTRPPVVEPEPERRTVSLEVLTDELREVGSPEGVPADARVGVILRRGGKPVVVADTDAPWRSARPNDSVWILRGMLTEAISGVARLEREHGHDVDLLMPTPDVLAALDGRPDAQLLTAPVWVLALDIEPGMFLASLASDDLRRVTGKPVDCATPGCTEGKSCVVLPFDGGEQHQSGYARTLVRIPAEVTA